MDDEAKPSWVHSTSGVLIVQGLLGPAVGAIVGVFIAPIVAEREQLDWRWLALVGVVVAVAIFLLISLIAKKLRGVVWGSVGRLGRWLGGIRPMTRRKRDALYEKGYAERSAEVDVERNRSPRPAWRVSRRDDDEFVYIHNSGYAVKDVVVRADPALFVFAGGAAHGFIAGELGDNERGSSSGRQVPGIVTREGERLGVEFDFSWTDQNGDAQPTVSENDLPHTATLPPRPLLPVTQPAWSVGKPKRSTMRDELCLVNEADGFVGTDVVVEADPYHFTFTAKRELGDLVDRGMLRFAGRPTEAGRVLGVTFTVTYHDVNGDERTDLVPTEFGVAYGF